MTEAYYTPREVAAMFRVSYHAVLRAIDRGDLEAVRACNRLRISDEAIEAYREANRVVPRPRGPVRVAPADPSPRRRTAARPSPAAHAVGSLARLRAIEGGR